ncbi:hypothetical protein U4960_03110 [Altererythrobacter sp. H2]|uniref:head-tail connector protein n=1 Tax=Altererythrobacter sp. H2 TaxID=3108391 RepID=UPI002B4BB897|nr:hypothetical protein [Altererythrobacter sp. H2]WRK96338.1 hypothetical protein U4960_03110 [Altererythrobacter sp. H2]
MRRTIIAPADPGAAALAELKDWLGIRTPAEDALLGRLLASALEACEAFTGTMPLIQGCAEVLPVRAEWQRLSTRPVSAITQAIGLPAEGSAFPLAGDAFELEIEADGTGLVRVFRPGAAGRIDVRYIAGLASQWNGLPDALRHGALRLAAHLYRNRDSGTDAALPAAVAALWRPWRVVRLA